MSKQARSIKMRKRHNHANRSSAYTAAELEGMARELVEAGLCSESILTAPRTFYQRKYR